MKHIISIFIILFLNYTVAAQIKAFKCDQRSGEADSNHTVYNVIVRFDRFVKQEEQWNLVKTELEKEHNITPNSISEMESFIRKRYREYLYIIKVRKEEPGDVADGKS